MTQRVTRPSGATLETTRCPIRIDGGILSSEVGSPTIGEHTSTIDDEFHLSAVRGQARSGEEGTR